ncbi:orotidine-5'-phosphate decarboxylase [Vagococcus sp. PNs007]|uniref:Orotidine 5'-phosphate decarboxylase n=1 Tax=Vagococcus proximus TaxID=2991417 RepID=A0ABT5WYS2_9ENTE|nr:orotidine-5'-phosphate decarboxylase [Vagococcus proximus]MDF0478905.1 orotidine-5'-phosphate decarboxylase [Vagococcus proximus]
MKRPIIALDLPSRQAIDDFLSHFPKDESLYLKVGMELYYQEGPAIVRYLKELGHDIFLDLKMHDIPNTVERAMKGIAGLGIKLTNIHAAGGKEMMVAAVRGLETGKPSAQTRPQLIAVTQLTSTSDEQVKEEQLIPVGVSESAKHYARLTHESGVDGVVCSALEVEAIKKATASDFICLTPGIRPKGTEIGDQKRVVTPEMAYTIGSDLIVVGRPITQAENPYEVYLTIKKEWNGEKSDANT